MHAALEETRARDERVRAAAAAYLPQWTGTAGYGIARGFDEAVTNGGATAVLVGLALPLWDGGFRAAQWEAAKARLQSAKALEQQRRADIVLKVRTAYLLALAALAQAAIHGDAVRVLDEYVMLLREQEGRGFVPRTETLRAEIALEAARASERAAELGAKVATQELSVLAGVVVSVADLQQPPVTMLREPSAVQVESSPVIMDAKLQADAARRDADAVRSEQRSRLTLTAEAGFLGVRPDRALTDNAGGQFLLGLSVPISDGGAANARAAAALATAASLEATVEQLREATAIALAQVRTDAERARSDIAVWERAVPRAADAFQLMRARYFGGGNVRLLEVLDALAQAVDARLAVVKGRLACELAAATQDQILGVTP